MRGLGRKLSFLAAVAVMATALAGAAHTLWYERLTLGANITTGTLDGSILCATNLDNENPSWPAPGTPIDPFEQYPKANPLKDVATALVTRQGSTLHEWVLQVGNTYPGYMFDCEIHVANTGTVPWHVELVQIKVTLPDGTTVFGSCGRMKCTYGDRDPYTQGLSELYVEVANFEGCQVHANDDKNASLFIGINQAAKEASQYKVELAYQVNQWNESNWFDCGRDNPDRPGPVLPPT